MPHGGTLHALLAIVTACVVAPATALDYDAAMNASQAAVGRTLDDYAFTDGDGRRVRLADFRGKPLVVSFIYTGCGQVCPTTTKFVDRAVRQADRELGEGTFRVASIGFNLSFDNPAAMRNLAREQGVDRGSGWKRGEAPGCRPAEPRYHTVTQPRLRDRCLKRLDHGVDSSR